LPLFAYLLGSSPTLGAGLQVVLRYQRVLQTLNRATLVVDGDVARLVVEVRPRHVEPLRHAITFAMAYLLTMARSITATPITPRSVRLAHAPPCGAEAIDEYRRVFGVDVRFGETPTEMSFESALLARPIPRADGALGELLERHAAALVASLPESPSLSLTEVALLLGFADQTTFHRAFVRWTAKSPGAYRKDVARAR
jgi:AraC-like DNA-binding protein